MKQRTAKARKATLKGIRRGALLRMIRRSHNGVSSIDAVFGGMFKDWMQIRYEAMAVELKRAAEIRDLCSAIPLDAYTEMDGKTWRELEAKRALR